MAILFFFLMACGTTVIDLVEDCDVLASSVQPSEAAPGEQAAVTVSPVTTHWDTAVYLSGTRAEVVDITRVGCEGCDTCREEEGCLACSDCDACDAVCKTECIESVVFVVPPTAAGKADVVVYNSSGTSNPVPIMVTPSSDTGEPDTGSSADDSGDPVDTGDSDTTEDTGTP